jgi:multiple antibiotic resistance protein
MNFYLEHFQYGLLCFSSLFTLINPFGILPIYLTMTQNITKQQRKDINQKGLIAAGSILIIFAFLGEFIFSIYGITIEAFKIAGGIIFFRIGLSNLESKISRIKSTPMEEKEALIKDGFAFTPFAIPFIAGPGSISSSMILSNSADTFVKKITFIISIFLCLIITYFIFQAAGRVSKKLGTIGIRILQRIMGLLLCVIAIQFIIDGVAIIFE